MKPNQITISACPSCGSSAIRNVKGNWNRKFRGKSYTVRSLEYFVCPKCREKIYPPEAMRRIQQHSPAYARLRQRKFVAVLVQKGKRSLKQLIVKVTNKNRHAEIDCGPPIGRESW